MVALEYTDMWEIFSLHTDAFSHLSEYLEPFSAFLKNPHPKDMFIDSRERDRQTD